MSNLMINDNNFCNIQGWMRTILNLSGNDLLVYAIIYGFSQDGNSYFSGSRQYLADWCGCTVRGITKNLENLVEKNLIIKEDFYINGVKMCKYQTNFNTLNQHRQEFTTSEHSSLPYEHSSLPYEHSSLNNIDNTKDNNIDNITNTKVLVDKPKQRQLVETLDEIVKPKESRYDKCVREINKFTDDTELNSQLTRYLQMRLQMGTIYVNQWKGLLSKLKQLASTLDEQIDIVKYCIEKGYKSFYPVPSYYHDNHSHILYTRKVLSEPKEMDDADKTKYDRSKVNGKSY